MTADESFDCSMSLGWVVQGCTFDSWQTPDFTVTVCFLQVVGVKRTQHISQLRAHIIVIMEAAAQEPSGASAQDNAVKKNQVGPCMCNLLGNRAIRTRIKEMKNQPTIILDIRRCNRATMPRLFMVSYNGEL
jgi:hypothetical protein